MALVPCQSQIGYGDVGAWSTPPMGSGVPTFTFMQEQDNISCLAGVQAWQDVGVQVLPGESLAVIAGGEVQLGAGVYAYPEGEYPGGMRTSSGAAQLQPPGLAINPLTPFGGAKKAAGVVQYTMTFVDAQGHEYGPAPSGFVSLNGSNDAIITATGLNTAAAFGAFKQAYLYGTTVGGSIFYRIFALSAGSLGQPDPIFEDNNPDSVVSAQPQLAAQSVTPLAPIPSASDVGLNPVLNPNYPPGALLLKVTPYTQQPAWVGHDPNVVGRPDFLFAPGRSQFILFGYMGTLGGHVWACVNAAQYSQNIGCYSLSLRRYAGGNVGSALGPQYFEVNPAPLAPPGGGAAVTVRYRDSAGNIVTSGTPQQFTLAPSKGVMQPPALTIPAGAPQAVAVLQGAPQGALTVTVTPGGGPLSASPPQIVSVTVLSGATDASPCIPGVTRPYLRDAIRRKLGVVPPIDSGEGAPGEAPPGQAYPDNTVCNQAVGDALRLINRRVQYHNVTALPISVPAAASTALGPQFVPLAGVGGLSPTNNYINSVRRAVWFDGSVYRQLRSVSFFEMDRDRINFDNLPPGVPIEYYIEGYQIALKPAASQAGTLILYADTAVVGLCSDTATIDEMPSDYQAVIEDLAAYLVCTYRPGDFGDRVVLLKELWTAGIDELQKWLQNVNEEYQPHLATDMHRRRRVR